MTSSIPDHIGMDELMNMAEAAHEREQEENICPDCADKTFGGRTVEEVEALAQQILDESFETCDSPLLHKIIMIMICSNMLAWHTKMSQRAFKIGGTSPAISWARDAGKFQAILNILDTISVDEDDPTVITQ